MVVTNSVDALIVRHPAKTEAVVLTYGITITRIEEQKKGVVKMKKRIANLIFGVLLIFSSMAWGHNDGITTTTEGVAAFNGDRITFHRGEVPGVLNLDADARARLGNLFRGKPSRHWHITFVADDPAATTHSGNWEIGGWKQGAVDDYEEGESKDSDTSGEEIGPEIQVGDGTYTGARSQSGTTVRDSPPPSSADVNGNDQVDTKDLLDIAMNFGNTPKGDLTQYDLDGDGDIDSDDFLLAQQQLGQSGNPSAPAASLALHFEHIKALNSTDPTFQRAMQLFEEQLIKEGLVELVPKKTVLLANYPNPFNPETWIPYQLAKAADVTLTIYATNGQPVRTLALGHQPAGNYVNRARAAYWDGKNAFGESVASGLYFYTLTADDFSATRKMLIAK